MGSVSIVGHEGVIARQFVNPADYDGLKMWLEAESLGLSDTDPITTWTDLSGLGNSMTQSDGTKKPIYKTAILNGLAVARFDASNDAMTSSLTVANPFTIYAVGNYTEGASASRRMINGSNNWLIGPYSGTWQYYNNNFINDGTANTTFKRLCVVGTSTGANFFVNNTNIGSNASNGTPGTLNLAAAGAFAEAFGGDLAELIVYDNDHDSTKRATVDAYLAGKYGL